MATPEPISKQVIELRAKYASSIKTGRVGKNFGRYTKAMRDLLNEWNPVGSTIQEVKFLLGPPNHIHNDTIIYSIDGGYVATSWVFEHKGDRITQVRVLKGG